MNKQLEKKGIKGFYLQSRESLAFLQPEGGGGGILKRQEEERKKMMQIYALLEPEFSYFYWHQYQSPH